MYAATRDAMLQHTGLSDPWAALKALPVDAVELAVGRDLKTEGFPGAEGGRPFDLAAPPDLAALKARLREERVRVCALLMANDFSGDLETEVRWGVAAVNAARELGAPAVRVDMVPRSQRDMPLDLFARHCIEAARKILAETEGSGVALGVENHGRVSNDPAFLERIFEGVGSERMGLTLDTGNFYWWGHPLEQVYGIMERFAARVRHTHVKNIHYPEEERARQREIGWKYGEYSSPLDEGDLDHARVAKLLQAAGYEGALTLEDESIGKAPEAERPAVLKRDIEHLRACLRAS